jgi:hypothetical protein
LEGRIKFDILHLDISNKMSTPPWFARIMMQGVTGTMSLWREAKPCPVRINSTLKLLSPIQIGAGRFSEQWLQELIFRHPACLPVGEIEPGFGELVSVGMEIPTSHGPIDNLLITPEGQIVLVEAKLWRNPQARREVVAQALDYASCIFEWDYEELEQRVLVSSFGPFSRPQRLYDLFEGRDGLALADFVDAINTNLRRGRILILVVGDGIRTEAKRLATMLQSHAGAHFTFALVELNVFEVDSPEDVLVVPRVLAQTEMIARGVVEVHDQRVTISLPSKSATTAKISPTASGLPENITADEFYEAMARLSPTLPAQIRDFLSKLGDLGVRADFQRSLNLRWDPPTGRTINLGVIHRDGQVWTDAVNARAPRDLAHAYIEELAGRLGMDVDKTSFAKDAWHVRRHGKAPRITEILDKLNIWVDAVAHLTSAMRERASHEA